MTWQIWIIQNHDLLTYWAKRRHFAEWNELLQQLVIYIEKNWDTFSKIPDGSQRIKWCQVWYKNHVKWKNSDFNKIIHRPDEVVGLIDEVYEIEDGEEQDWLEVDLLPGEIRWADGFSFDEVVKLRKIKAAYNKLNDKEKILYDLYFGEMLSQRAIAKKINIPHSAVYNMLKELREKIKNLL